MTTPETTDVKQTNRALRELLPTRVGWARSAVLQVGFLLVAVTVWHLLVAGGTVSRLVLPEPLSVVQSFWDNIWSIVTGGYVRRHLLITAFEAGAGFVIASLVGVIIGALISEFWSFRVIFRPYLLAFNATPRIVLAPLVLVWFGFGPSSKVALAASIAVFPVVFGTIAGLDASEGAERRLMQAYGATPWQAFWKLRFYVALPYIFAGLEMAMGLAFLGAVAGEFVGGSAGLGYLVLVSLETLNLGLAFATIFLLSVSGYLFHRVILAVQRRVIYWRT